MVRVGLVGLESADSLPRETRTSVFPCRVRVCPNNDANNIKNVSLGFGNAYLNDTLG